MALGDTANALENRLDAQIEQLRQQSAAQMADVKRDIERALRDALEGGRSRTGMLEIVCDVRERASAKLPGWLASMNHNGELDVN
ncbi:hypothetical protein ABTQ07_19780, partial [Acinetobacter baumannii]